jgi:hypothetical protein
LSKKWIQSFPGCRQVFPAALTAEAVAGIADIAHALSHKCRFTGHVRWHYSVAQHCVLGAKLMPAPFALPFLLHEVSEVYLPDVSAPLKPDVWVQTADGLIPWTELEQQHAEVIFPALGLASLLPLLHTPEVKHMDLAMLAAEKEQLCGEPPDDWHLSVPAADVRIERWSPERAEQEFLMLFNGMMAGMERVRPVRDLGPTP